MGSTRLYRMASRHWHIFGNTYGAIMFGVIGLGLLVSPGLAQTAATAPASTPAAPHHPPTPHHGHFRHHRHRVAVNAARPPQAPPPATPVEAAAPLPNEDVQPPHEQLQPGVNVVPGNLQLHFPPSGDGYLPASSEQTLDETRAPKVPGVTLTVPLGQPNGGPPP
jgi:hypothetical protein